MLYKDKPDYNVKKWITGELIGNEKDQLGTIRKTQKTQAYMCDK